MPTKVTGVANALYTYLNWLPTTGYGSYVFQGPSNIAQIAYENPLFKRFGDCTHGETKVEESSAKCYGAGGSWSNTHWSFKLFNPSAVPTDTGFNSRAFAAMKPRIKTEVQAPLEIKEFLLGWRELLKPFQLQKSFLSKAGSTNLWWQFGVAPTLGTIRDTRDALKKFEQRLNSFLELQGQELTSHYQEITEYSEETVNTGSVMSGTIYTWQTKNIRLPYKLYRTATMRYRYIIPRAKTLRRETIELLAMADTFGVSAGVSMLWEAFPWSFVWDWFLNVGEFLEQFDSPFLDTEVEILDYCISTKANRTFHMYMWRSVSGWVKGTEVHFKSYVRTRCLPDYTMFGIRESDNFGTKQFFLGLSLLVA